MVRLVVLTWAQLAHGGGGHCDSATPLVPHYISRAVWVHRLPDLLAWESSVGDRDLRSEIDLLEDRFIYSVFFSWSPELMS